MRTMLGRDDEGYLCARDGTGFVYRLTECCHASAKGAGDGTAGSPVICRACYAPADPGTGCAPVPPFGGYAEIRFTHARRYTVTVAGSPPGDGGRRYATALAALRAVTAAGTDPERLSVWWHHEFTGQRAEFTVPLPAVTADFTRAPTDRDKESWLTARILGCVIPEALCMLCGDLFNPGGADDMTHLERVTGARCGGPGALLGVWRADR